LFDGIKADLFAPSACGFIQCFPQTQFYFISFVLFGKQTHTKKKTTDKQDKINKQTHE